MILEIKGKLDMEMKNKIMMKMTNRTALKSELEMSNGIKMNSFMTMTIEIKKMLEMTAC